jgi:hypothetical protein
MFLFLKGGLVEHKGEFGSSATKYDMALSTVASISQGRTLTTVYQRLLRKMEKLDAQLQVSHSMFLIHTK